MKNKWKKMLAIGCIGIAGLGFTGCSLSADQTEALDLITEKADDIIELLEDNMEYNRTEISKAEAAEKILIGRNYWALGLFDQLEFTLQETHYDGWFDKVKAEGSAYTTYYKKSDNSKYKANVYNNNDIQRITVSNFSADKHYTYDNNNTSPTFQERPYSSEDFIIKDIDVFTTLGIGTITADDIVEIERIENGYRFKTLNRIEAVDAIAVNTFEMLDNGFITSLSIKGLMKIGSTYESVEAKATYKYDNIDFSIVENKLAELNIEL